MKRIVVKASFVFVAVLALASCKKGTCTCTVFGSEISTKVTADDREEYKDAKNSCQDAGCEWSAGH